MVWAGVGKGSAQCTRSKHTGATGFKLACISRHFIILSTASSAWTLLFSLEVYAAIISRIKEREWGTTTGGLEISYMEEDVLYMVIVFVIQVIVGLLLNYASGRFKGQRVMLWRGSTNIDTLILLFNIDMISITFKRLETKFFGGIVAGDACRVIHHFFASCDLTVNGLFVRMRGFSYPSGITLDGALDSEDHGIWPMARYGSEQWGRLCVNNNKK